RPGEDHPLAGRRHSARAAAHPARLGPPRRGGLRRRGGPPSRGAPAPGPGRPSGAARGEGAATRDGSRGGGGGGARTAGMGEGRLFGTDGVRGTANVEPMTSETALRLGRALAHVSKRSPHRHRILIGKDTRLSGYMLETAMASGICSMGVDVLLVG